ncbi:FAD-binding monooxygenase [Streptomonospora alba]|uniref:FAD-binding monooxygenase n=1 Tax=Streptomonospora alba TaxID=183763 RepID=A0A0C2JJF1_9ACTN|nr:FAD-dependent monooxygenase [Streptomonospora alba]KIH99060.1 FAD-binding monooxygenase [Streptomonospora alba]
MAERLTATVVGGGIAGLAAAVALEQAGWRTRVLERASAFGEVGAGVALTRNGVAAFKALGFDDHAVDALGYETPATGLQDMHGRWLLRVPGERDDVRSVTTILGSHRKRLHAALRGAAETVGAELLTGAAVTGVRPGAADGGPAEVTWESGGTTHSAASDLVVGADGIWSAVRNGLFPDVHPRYSGATSWRAVVPDTTTDGGLAEMWGPSAEFGALRVSDTEVYWYGYFQHPEGASFADEKDAALQRFGDWAPRVPAMIDATAADRLMRHDVYHLPGGLPTYTVGRVVMVGDAAHAALPTVGQGAATALEDGICVGRLVAAPVAAGGAMAPAMAAYDRTRRPRCRAIARRAVQLARFGADLGGGWRQSARNTALRLIPGALAAKGAGGSIMSWTPPK